MAAVAAPASILQQAEANKTASTDPSAGPPVFASVGPSRGGVRFAHSIKSWATHAWHHVSAQHVCHLRPCPQTVLSQCTIAVHAADVPRPISTGKLHHLQETAVTTPHRIKPVTRSKKHKRMYIQCSDELHRQHVPRPCWTCLCTKK
jgi:hypothetical protein